MSDPYNQGNTSTKSVTYPPKIPLLFGRVNAVSQDNQLRAPAGWYPDPLGLPQLRWWNNHGWTEQVSAAPEPLVIQESQFAWKEPERPVQEAPATPQAPVAPQQPVAPVVNELEAPRSFNRVDEPTTYESWQATSTPVAAASTAIPVAPAAATPAPPAFWDDDDMSTPTPSVRPEDLKFWSAPNPADLRRAAREQAARESGN
jgi:hypothetical protein